jgi:hypothetical protein
MALNDNKKEDEAIQQRIKDLEQTESDNND